MRRALISDIHGNLEALEAVLEDIRSQNVDEIFCLGDIIGYGPNPKECIDLVMEHCKVTLLGNHDQGAMYDPLGFHQGAEKAIFWTRAQLESPRDRERNDERWEFLNELPRTYRVDHFLFVHGSPRNPLGEYIFPDDIYQHRKMERLFQLVEKYCFQGHTHVPGVFTENYQFFSPEEIDYEYVLTDSKAMVNVGSVGQPRDGDSRACYVVLDDGRPAGSGGGERSNGSHGRASRAGVGGEGDSDPETKLSGLEEGSSPGSGSTAELRYESVAAPGVRLAFRRVPYDFEATIAKIYEIPELDRFLGDRLRQGR